MNRKNFRFIDRLRVRWAEIDAQKIVFNGHYLMYFDTAIASYWRALALPYAQTMESLSGDLFVRKATVEYLASAEYDDVLDIGMRCARIGNSSITFEGAIFRQEQLLVTGELVYVFADPREQRSRPVPDVLRNVLQGYETGEPMIDVCTGAWSELGVAAGGVRNEVFVVEQKIPKELEWDEADESATHAVGFNRFGVALATGRLIRQEGGLGRIGRMAVCRAVRSGGVGRLVLDALEQAAREQGLREIMLHAQTSAQSFYVRAGYVQHGAVFEEAGIAHIEMRKPL